MVKHLMGLAIVVCVARCALAQGAPDLGEIDDLVKASAAKFKGPALAELVAKVQKRIAQDVPAYAATSGWIASIRTMASQLATPVPATPIEFGPIRTVSEKTGRAPVAPDELFRPRTVAYRFGTRDFFRFKEEPKVKGPIEPKDVTPANQLVWILIGCPPEVELAIAATAGMVRDMEPNREAMKRAAGASYATATDLADWLVSDADVPFREAHHISGRAVAAAEAAGKALDQLSLDELRAVDPRIDERVLPRLSVEFSVAARRSAGGTAPERVRQAIARARAERSAREK